MVDLSLSAQITIGTRLKVLTSAFFTIFNFFLTCSFWQQPLTYDGFYKINFISTFSCNRIYFRVSRT